MDDNYTRPTPEEELAMITATDNGPHDGDPEQQPTAEDVAALREQFEEVLGNE